MPSLTNKAACKGSIVHKSLELLARKKHAIQQGKSIVEEAELGLAVPLDEITPSFSVEKAWSYYTQKESHLSWKPADLKDCHKWTQDVLTKWGGVYNPLNCNVLAPEQYFEFVIKEDWAKYDYVLPDGQRISGYLGLKGTVDLVTEDEPGIIHYQDYKTGARKDWATDKIKDWDSLRNDPQLRIYHYALSKHLYPKAKSIIMTILFVKDGGPFTLPFDKSDWKKTEDMLRERFEIIKNNNNPKLRKSYRCTSFCHYGKNNFLLPDGTDSGKTICQYYHDELVELGMDRMMKKHADLSAVASYEGGGRSK